MLQNVLQFNEASYKQFINGVAELVNSFLKPNVKRKWFRIDLVMVSIAHFQHLLFLLGLTKTFLAREACHPSQITRLTTTLLSQFQARKKLCSTPNNYLLWKRRSSKRCCLDFPARTIRESGKSKYYLSVFKAKTRLLA